MSEPEGVPQGSASSDDESSTSESSDPSASLPTPFCPADYEHMTIIQLVSLMAGHTEVPPEFHFWGALSLIAATLQNRVYFQHMAYRPTKPNLYVFLVGSSSSGKGAAITLVSKIADYLETGEEHIWLGKQKMKLTAPALYDLIAQQPEEDVLTSHPIWMLHDELSNSIRTGELARDFIKTATDLWEGHAGVIAERTRTRGTLYIKDPCLNWLAGSTITWLKEVVDYNDVDSGFFGRTLVVFGKRSTTPIAEPDTSLYEPLLPIIKRKLAILWHYEGKMTLSQEARERRNYWYTDESLKQTVPSFLEPTYGRRLDMLDKLAMLFQCSLARDDESWRIITQQSVEWAIETHKSVMTYYRKIIEDVIIGRADRKMERVQSFLKKYKDVTRSRLQSAVSSYGIRKEDLDSILGTLMEQGSVKQYTVKNTWMVRWIDEF